jgi:hypothetical protein
LTGHDRKRVADRDPTAGRSQWEMPTTPASKASEHFKSRYHQGFGGQLTCIEAFCVPARTEHDAQAITGQSFLLVYGRLEIPSAWGRNET